MSNDDQILQELKRIANALEWIAASSIPEFDPMDRSLRERFERMRQEHRELAKLGGRKKVPKGFSAMDPERRSEIAAQAAAKRWAAKRAPKKRTTK